MTMRIQPEIGEVSIVLIGRFNPVIFQPAWFARQGLIADEEAESAEVAIIHPEVTDFSIDWLLVHVETDKVIFRTSEEPAIKLLDLVNRLFEELLEKTPIVMLGINRMVHFQAKDFEAQNRLGRMLAPLEPWGEWGKQILDADGDPEANGGMRSLTIEQSNLTDRERGYIRAKIEPSSRVKFGVFMDINDHYDMGVTPDKVDGCAKIMRLLRERFEPSLERSAWIVDQIMESIE